VPEWTSRTLQRGETALPSTGAVGDRNLIHTAARGKNGIIRRFDTIGQARGIMHHDDIANFFHGGGPLYLESPDRDASALVRPRRAGVVRRVAILRQLKNELETHWRFA
jgi:hypothetical protein